MEENQKHQCEGGSCEKCQGGEKCHCMCACWHHHRRGIIKFVIGLILVSIVFCAGVQLGELKGMLRSERGYSQDNQGYGRYGMMRSAYYGDGQQSQGQVATTSQQ